MRWVVMQVLTAVTHDSHKPTRFQESLMAVPPNRPTAVGVELQEVIFYEPLLKFS
jgi:hypothetical protein